MTFDNKDGRIRGARGVEIRRRFLSSNPLCVKCQDQGLITLAEEVDHIKALHAQGEDTDENKQALCKPCHRAKTTLEQGNSTRAQAYPEWLEPASGPLTIVFGPPASGKTTYIEQHAKPDDQVIDLDLIKVELSGAPIYTQGKEWYHPSVRVRNKMLGNLKRDSRPAWFIATGTGKADREWWISKLQPTDVVVLDVPEAECIGRINADDRRPPDMREAHIRAVRSWWHAERGFAVKTRRRVVIGADGWPVAPG